MPVWIPMFECSSCGEMKREEEWVECEECGADICWSCAYMPEDDDGLVQTLCEDCYIIKGREGER